MAVAAAPQLEAIAALIRDGQLAAATQACRQLLATEPGLGDGWYNLGYLLRRQADFAGALQAYARALACGAAGPEQIHLNRAAIYSDHLQHYPLAQRELEQALQRRPGYGPALLNLGNLNEDLGRRTQAQAAYRALLAAAPPAEPALRLQAQARLLELDPDVPPSAALRALQQTADAGGLDDALRATAWFALARAHERRHERAAAFAAASNANRLAHGGSPRYAAAAVEHDIGQIIQTFARRVPTDASVAPGPRPLFICGMFRSGSTLLEQVLSRHPQVQAGGESEALPRLVRSQLQPFPQAAAGLSEVALAALAKCYRAATVEQLVTAPDLLYLTDKRPDNVLLVGLIMRMFPQARIVLTTREPMDTGISIFMHHLNPRAFPYAGRLQDIGHYQRQIQRLGAHWRQVHADSVHVFDYDAFVAAPEPTLRALLAALGLTWEPACLQPQHADSAVRTASHWQVRAPVHANASGRWRGYGALLDPLRQALETPSLPTD